jgi:hypothetical protein
LYASPIRRASVDAFGAGLAKRGQNMQTKVSMVVLGVELGVVALGMQASAISWV